MVSRAVIESVKLESQDLMSGETLAIMEGEGNLLAFQLFELYYNYADLHRNQNLLLTHLTDVKASLNVLGMKYKQLTEPKPSFWDKVFSRDPARKK